MGYSKNKLINLPFFTPPSSYDKNIRDLHKLKNDEIFIFAGGRFYPEKGFDILIHSLADLKKKDCNLWKAVIIGHGKEYKFLKELISSYKLNKKILILPWVESDTFRNYIATADIFVAPARQDHFPTTIIDAMKAKTCIVSSDKPGSSLEFITDNVDGRIIDSDNIKLFSEALEELIKNKNKREYFANNAKNKIDEWDIQRGCDIFIKECKLAYLRGKNVLK